MVIAVLEVSLKGVAVPWQWFRPMRSNWACGPFEVPDREQGLCPMRLFSLVRGRGREHCP